MPEAVDENQFRILRIERKVEIAREIWSLEMAPVDARPLTGYRPGANVTVKTPSGARRRYSLCESGQTVTRYVLGIKPQRPGRGASVSLVDGTAEGDTLEVSEPENSFPLVDAARYLFIAGGIGITPIMSMLRYLKDSGHREFQLIYCTRDPQSTAFGDELADGFFKDRVTLHHDGGDPDSMYDLWPLFETPGDEEVYCCGPRPMMDEVGDMSGHWRPGSIHFEDFASDVEAVHADDKAFTVRHADSGETFEIAADTTILESLRSQGCELRSSCESGTCGSCRVELVEGIADHRDMVLEPCERDGSIMICVSRASSGNLVLRW